MASLTLPSSSSPRVPVLLWLTAARVVAAARRRPPTAPQLAMALAAVLALGIGISILTTTDALWWQQHFSALGTFHDFSGEVFNATLVLGGGMIVVFAFRVRIDLATLAAAGRRRPRLLVILMTSAGAHLAVVGFVPVDTWTFVHDRAASGVMFCFGAVLVSVGREWMVLPTPLRVGTAVITVALGGVTPVFLTGAINLAAFEAIGFSLIFAWLGVFTTSLHATAQQLLGHEPQRS